MSTTIISEGWDRLGERQESMMTTVHQRLLQRYPHYEQVMPLTADRAFQRLLQTMVMAARLEEYPDIAETGLVRLARRHRQRGLTAEHLGQLQEVFLEVIAEFHAHCWDEQCRQVWRQVLEELVIPQLKRGLEALSTQRSYPTSRVLAPIVSKWVPYGRCSACH